MNSISPEMPLVFVYGSLRKEGYNHSLLTGSPFIGQWRTPEQYTLYDLGYFPAVCLNGNSPVTGEIYSIDKRTMRELDHLEGFPQFYNRSPIPCPWGETLIYHLNNPPEDSTIISSGDWLKG